MKQFFTLLFIFLVCSSSAYAQSGRTIPYPIIFVHGWTGNDKSWYEMGKFLQVQGLRIDLTNDGAGKGSKIDFHLNADGNNTYSRLDRSTGGPRYGDVLDYSSQINPNNDVFIINFDNPFNNSTINSYSNQAAAVKQGFAVGLAVKKVLQATGADKVILFGHSMGGLAIREYLQNTVNWLTFDGQHHVAKLITTGTPHSGSNSSSGNLSSIFGLNERSEAVRDLRYPYDYSTTAGRARGMYLFGRNGDIESDINRFGLNYFNNDVDCDGRENSQVQGLNTKDLYSDVAYSCIIGTGEPMGNGIISPDGDGVVEANKATLFNLGYEGLSGDTFKVNKDNQDNSIDYSTMERFALHSRLPKQRYVNLQALDEPGTNALAYEIKSGKAYKGFFSPQTNTYNQDFDRYKVYLNDKGSCTVAAIGPSAITFGARLVDASGAQYGIGYATNGTVGYVATIPQAGWYYLTFEGNTFNNNIYQYSYSIDFKVILDKPSLIVVGPQTVCNGESVKLLGPPGYSFYRWFKDGVKVQDSDNVSFVTTTSGNYALVTSRNGAESPVSDLTSLIFKPTSPAPVVPTTPTTYCVGDVAQPLSATGTQLQWYTSVAGGTPSGTVPTISTASARTVTYYVTQTTANSCESVRQPVTVNVTAPPTAPGVVANQFVCQFSKAAPVIAQGQNLLWRGSGLAVASETAPSPTTDKVDTLRYTVTQRVGSCISPAASVVVTVRKAPEPPKVVTPVSLCINTKASGLSATGSGIKWYTKADRSGQSSVTVTPSTDNAGSFTYYATQTDGNGCESLTTPANVTIRPRPTATLPSDIRVTRYDSVAVPIVLTGDAPWRVTLWNGREITSAQSPLVVYVKPTTSASYALQNVTNECGAGSTGSAMRITLLEPLAVSSQPDDFRLLAYPTPTEGTLQVEWIVPAGQSATLRLITLTGQTIWQRPVRGTGTQQTESLQLHTRPSGRYILQLATPKGILNRQILKQ